MKFINFFLFLWVIFYLSIPIVNPDMDLGTPLNPDPIQIRMRIHNIDLWYKPIYTNYFLPWTKASGRLSPRVMTVLIKLTQARRSLTLTTTAAPLYVLQYDCDELEFRISRPGLSDPDPYPFEMLDKDLVLCVEFHYSYVITYKPIKSSSKTIFSHFF